MDDFSPMCSLLVVAINKVTKIPKHYGRIFSIAISSHDHESISPELHQSAFCIPDKDLFHGEGIIFHLTIV